jgi:hypothetical protein
LAFQARLEMGAPSQETGCLPKAATSWLSQVGCSLRETWSRYEFRRNKERKTNMALKFKYKTREEVPAEVVAFYAEREGEWVLDCDGVAEKTASSAVVVATILGRIILLALASLVPSSTLLNCAGWSRPHGFGGLGG